MAEEKLSLKAEPVKRQNTSDLSKLDVFPAYALYRYTKNNRPAEEGSEHSEDSIDKPPTLESSTTDISPKESNANASIILSVVLSSLDEEHEECLRKFITRKLFRGTMYSRSGHIANVDLSCEPDEDLMGLCYYCLLRQQLPSGGSTSNSVTSNEYVVCFMTSTNVLLDLFRSELDRYSTGLLSLVESDPTDLEAAVRPYLEQWYPTITKYLCKCVNLFGEDIKYLLHAALSGAKLEVHCSDQDLKTDTNKFVHCCSLAELMDNSKPAERAESSSSLSDSGALLVDLTDPTGGIVTQTKDSQTPVVTLTMDGDNRARFQNQECTQFCDDWAQALTSGDPSNPVFIRQIIDSFKLKAIHDMNTLKRLLRLAEADHYALYRCYAFLCSCGNGSILMQHAHLENAANGSPAATHVLKVLEEHIQESDGFQLPRKKIPQTVS